MKPDFEDMVNRSGGNISVRDAEILYETATEIQAKRILEIGSREGGSSMALGLVAKNNDGLLDSVDPVKYPKWWSNIYDYGLEGFVCHHNEPSPWVITFPTSRSNTYTLYGRIGDRGALDYLFLDGGGSKTIPHHTRWMLVDYHYWEPLVRIGGRIAFHDWTGKNCGHQVQRAVSIILETDDLIEVARHESTDRGIIVFEKRG